MRATLNPKVDFDHAFFREGSTEPDMTVILRSEETDTRTGVRHNPLAQMKFDEFKSAVDKLVEQTKVFHFEVSVWEIARSVYADNRRDDSST